MTWQGIEIADGTSYALTANFNRIYDLFVSYRPSTFKFFWICFFYGRAVSFYNQNLLFGPPLLMKLTKVSHVILNIQIQIQININLKKIKV